MNTSAAIADFPAATSLHAKSVAKNLSAAI